MPRMITSRTNRRTSRYHPLCNTKCNTKCLHFFLALSRSSVLNAPSFVRPTSRRRGSNNIFAAFLRVVLRFERQKCSSSRRKHRQHHQRGKISFRILFPERRKLCLQNASERRSIAHDASKWSTMEALVDRCFFEGLCSVRLSRLCAL